jgi:N-acetylmuramoyl-L-alanine amidase
MRLRRLYTIPVVLAIGAACHNPAPLPPNPAPGPARQTPQPVAAQPPAAAPDSRGNRTAPPLPPIPLVEGPLNPKVVFPERNQSIPVRDSNFVFGSVGNGHARLMINGTPVPVAPNGTFLAYLPVPPATAPRYDLVTYLGAAGDSGRVDTARTTIPVRVPRPLPDLSLTGRLVVDSASVSPRGGFMALRDSEPVRVTIRAPLNAIAWISPTPESPSSPAEQPTRRVAEPSRRVTGPPSRRPAAPPSRRAAESPSRRVAESPSRPLANVSGNTFATDVPAGLLKAGATLYVARGNDTVHFALTKPRDARSQWVSLGDPAAQNDTDATIIGRSTPAGTYKWMLVPGTIVEETGRLGDNVRVRFDSQLEVWVDSTSVRPLAANYPPPRRTVGAMSLVPAADWVDLVLPVSSPPPYLIEQDLGHITLTLYGTTASPDVIKFLQNDSLVRIVNWVPEQSDRVVFRMELSRPPYGYLVLFDPARGFILRLRRPPRVNPNRPLEGLVITVDPGHPPGGAIGPTALTEAEGVLPVSFKLRDILQQRGATVVMTRTTMEAVDLHLRSVIARRANANALISIHLNAFGDGVNPFPNVGTSTLFFHPQTEPLARLVQAGMTREMGLRDLGVHYQNIAIGRTMWMPSLICEGAFLMVPEQENAVKTPEFQDRYARGVADGIEAYFRSLAR